MDLEHSGDMEPDGGILTGLSFDHTVMITLSLKKTYKIKILALTWYFMITVLFWRLVQLSN